MKAIITNNNLVKYVFNDDTNVDIQFDKIVVNGNYLILDMNITNSSIVENVIQPEDYAGGKYYLNNSIWTLNSEYIASVVNPSVSEGSING